MGCAVQATRRRPGALGLGLGLGLLGLLLLDSAAAREPPDDCLLPSVVGRCRAAFPRWWYNATSQACQEFIYGGCGGNDNNFVSKKECFQACASGGEEEVTGTPPTSQGKAERPATEAAPTSSHRRRPAEDTIRFQEYCAAPRVTGHCRASFPRWYFDKDSQTCKMFIYGGCGGNRNNYLLEEDCLIQCAAGIEEEVPGEPGEDPSTHGPLFPDSALHSTRAVVLAVLLALLLASLLLVVVKICRRGREHSLSSVWSTMDDKELLMSSGYSL